MIVLVRQSTEQLTQNSNHWVRHWLSRSQHRPGSVRTWCMQKSTQTKLGWFRKIPQYNAWGLYILHPFGGWTTNCFFHQRAIVPLICLIVLRGKKDHKEGCLEVEWRGHLAQLLWARGETKIPKAMSSMSINSQMIIIPSLFNKKKYPPWN